MPYSAESVSAAATPPAAWVSTSHDNRKRFALLLVLLTLSLVTFASPSASRIHGWPFSTITVALWLLPVGMVLHGVARASCWRLPPPLLMLGLGLLAAGTFIAALVSPFPGASLPRVWPAVGGVTLYLWLHHAWSLPEKRAARFEHIARVLGFAAVAFTFVSLAQWSRGLWPLPWGGRNAAPFGHSTYTAGAIILLLPWVVCQAVTSRYLSRVLWLFAVAAALAVLISTSSRGGVLALACVILAAATVALVSGHWSRRRQLMLTAVLFTIGGLAVFTNPRLRELVLHRRWSEASRESNAQRQAMFAAGLLLGVERPLLGWGPGTVPLVYPRVRARLDGGTENVLQLHNTPVQLWATTGTIGVIAMVLLAGGSLAEMMRARRTPILFAASASLLGYGVVALTDHQLDLPFMAVLLATNLALLTSADPRVGQAVQPSRLRRALVGVPFAVLVLVSLRATIPDQRARQLYDSALTLLGRNQQDAFIATLDRATDVTPHDSYFQHRAAAWLLNQRENTGDATRQRSLANTAAARLEQSLTTGAHQEFAHFNLGWLHLDFSRPTEAVSHFVAAARLVPDKGGIYFGLGLAYNMAGQPEAAVRSFALEIINDPRSLTSPAWELPALAALQPKVRDEVFRLFSRLRHEFPPARAMEAWTRWWWGESVSLAELRPGFNAESARFLAALPAIARDEPVPSAAAAWSQAYAAWQTCRTAGVMPPPDAFMTVARGDRAFAAALAWRAQRHPDDFRQFLTAPTGDDPTFLRTLRRERIGYGMLAFHPEGPPLRDLYIVQENRVFTDLAAALLPAKGWLPGRFLLALLPDS